MASVSLPVERPTVTAVHAPGGSPAASRTNAARPAAPAQHGDRLSTGASESSKTYNSPKARGKGGEVSVFNYIKLSTSDKVKLVSLYVGLAAVTSLIPLTMLYFVAKRAVHKGVVQAARDGVVGNQQNRLNAASA